MSKLTFFIDETWNGGYVGRALGHSIFVQAETIHALRDQVRDAVNCHFSGDQAPKSIRLNFFLREEVILA
jgi:hypothetical protein